MMMFRAKPLLVLLACSLSAACQATESPATITPTPTAKHATLDPTALEQHPCWSDKVSDYTALLDDQDAYNAVAECFEQDYQAADAALNQTYQAIQKDWGEDERYRETLKSAQRAWIRFRDADCAVFDIGSAGFKPIMFHQKNCLIQHTRLRTEQLNVLYQQ